MNEPRSPGVDRRDKIDAPKRCLAITKQHTPRKIEAQRLRARKSRMIKSVRGVGYVFTGEVRLV